MTDIPPLDRNQEMLLVLAKPGSPAALLEICYDLCPNNPTLDADTRRYTFGPIVYDNGGNWTDVEFVKEWKAMIYEERLRMLFGQLPGHRVSPTEIMIVMHSAIMSAPMGHAMTQLYLWAAKAATVARWGAERGPEFIASIPAPDYDDSAFLSADGSCHHDYVRLSNAIRRKVISNSKASGRRGIDFFETATEDRRESRRHMSKPPGIPGGFSCA